MSKTVEKVKTVERKSRFDKSQKQKTLVNCSSIWRERERERERERQRETERARERVCVYLALKEPL